MGLSGTPPANLGRASAAAKAVEPSSEDGEEDVQPLVSPEEVDREEYAEREATAWWVVALFELVVVISLYLWRGIADLYANIMVVMSLVAAAAWYGRSQGS